MQHINHPLQATDKGAKALAYWTANPVEAVKDWFGVTPEDYQGDIITALLKPGHDKVSRVAVKSSHGVGKTTTEAWCGWVFLNTRLMSKVIATAPTANQLLDVLWPEFSKWHARMPEELAGMWDISATHIRSKVRQGGIQFDKNWFATARTSNKQENLQGMHEDHIFVIAEEASGIPQPIFEPIEGIMTNAEEEGQEAILLMVGNPTQIGGEFYNAFHRNKGLYKRFTVSGDPDTKRDKNSGKFYISKRVSKKYRDNMAAKYGKDGPVYDVRVRGVFPREADDVVIPLSFAERAQQVPLPHFDNEADQITLVMDVARFGTNKTTLGVFRKGHCLAIHKWPKTSTNQCTDILEEAFFHGAFGVGTVPVARIIIDEPGVGGGVIDQARRLNMPITPYNGGMSLKKGEDPEDDIRMFSNRRARDWWNVRRQFELGLRHIPTDEDIVNELASVKYQYVMEKIKIENKKDMMERLGEDASPDLADTIIMGMAPFIGVHNTIPLETLDLGNSVIYGEDRPTANMDF